MLTTNWSAASPLTPLRFWSIDIAVPVLDRRADLQRVGPPERSGSGTRRGTCGCSSRRPRQRVTPPIVPLGPVSVTCDAVKVAGLISSLNVSCTELSGEAPCPSRSASRRRRTPRRCCRRQPPRSATPPVVTLPVSAGSAVVWSRTASITWLIDQVGMRSLHQGDRAGDERRRHRRAAHRRVAAAVRAQDVHARGGQLDRARAVVRPARQRAVAVDGRDRRSRWGTATNTRRVKTDDVSSLVPLLPAAATTITPCWLAYWIAEPIVASHPLPPQLALITLAPWSTA